MFLSLFFANSVLWRRQAEAYPAASGVVSSGSRVHRPRLISLLENVLEIKPGVTLRTGFEVHGSWFRVQGWCLFVAQASHPTGLLRRCAPRNDGLHPVRVFRVFRGGGVSGSLTGGFANRRLARLEDQALRRANNLHRLPR